MSARPQSLAAAAGSPPAAAAVPRLWNRIDRWLRRLDRALMFVGAAALVLIALIILADVVLRYAFNAPLIFSFDAITLYLFPVSVFFALSSAFVTNENIDFDFIARRLPPRVWRAGATLGGLTAAVVFAIVAWLFAGQALAAFGSGEVIFGAITWPTWPVKGLVAVGFAALALRVLHRALGYATGLAARPAAAVEQV